MSLQRPPFDPVFILRFWREALDGSGSARWRVQVRNINTGRRDVVDDVQSAFTIVTANLNAAEEKYERSEEPRTGTSGDDFDDKSLC
ncbi:hypothetical protein L6654_12630 [Bradyrhizobium sp. WYCCWR 13023]|uniref:Uncharacterized protein n=1 Tax=Bradyrhizobium zhengyangense TaxID=2911009 RepID=A0A9X1RB50_9BRAD|nr:hypothetical protein [Bradyrhizobium zhengyangense]MCG2627474.1 hypothetical protein [Bradyrhizobium zhengyangense]MCG2668925.1 hypothetical protein [Bradyrhizobium zhengyangense]MDA9526518.1 hypothetical protein [Bradyrhizobium sp. CCBAU 11434]